LKQKLIFHIGAHRTATSALQEYLHRNFEPLLEQGYFYPFKVRRHMKQINQLFRGDKTPEEMAQNLIARTNKRSHDIHTIILSDEDACMRRDLSVLAQFREWFDVKVVFTLRRQDSWLESWFFQNIKWQWNAKLSHCTFDEFMAMRDDFHWIHYDHYVRHLEELFGQDNIILNIHEKGQMQGGPIETFCNSIGLSNRESCSAPAHINQSYSPEMSEFMRCLPLGEAPVGYRNMLTRACAVIDQKIQGEGAKKQSERLMTPDQRATVMAAYEAGNQALAQRYFGRSQLFFDPLPDADAPLAEMALPQDSYALMRDLVTPLLQSVIEDHLKNKTGKKP